MSVDVICVGPGAADLLTVRASRLISRCGTCLFAGDAVSREVLSLCPPAARTVDATDMSPAGAVAEIRSARERGDRVVYLYPGDPASAPAVAGHLRELDAQAIGWRVVPGVPVFAAAGAALGVDLTGAVGVRSISVTRTDESADPLRAGVGPTPPASADHAAVFSVPAADLDEAVRELIPRYGADCPAGVVIAAGREGEATVAGTLRDIVGRTAATELRPEVGVVVVVGRILDQRPGGNRARTREPSRAPTAALSRPTAPEEARRSTPMAPSREPMRHERVPSPAGVPEAVPGRILVLGGTGEARRLADLMVTAGLDVVTSLTGSVSRPRMPRGEVRIGGFGDDEDLTRWIRENRVTALIDATDPFATVISSSALRVAQRTGVPFLRLHRPPWAPDYADDWIRVADTEAAARVVRERFRRPMLTVGRTGPTAFAHDTRGSYLIRCAEPPPGALPHRYLLVLDRGPFDAESERTIMSRHRIDVLVTRNSGSPTSVAKLGAARDLRIPVVMVDRPAMESTTGIDTAETVDSVEDAARWLVRRFGSH